MLANKSRGAPASLLFLTLVLVCLIPILSRTAWAQTEDKPDMTAKTDNSGKGTLYLIGGAAEETLDRFVELAGGTKAAIVVIPHASSVPKEVADETINQLVARGVKNVTAIMPDDKSKKLPKEVDAVYICGGDQNRLVRLMEPALVEEIRDFLSAGGVVGGTSAGAAAAAPRMIAGGMTDLYVEADSLLLGNGLGFLSGTVVDTHVLERARHDRLMAAVSEIDCVIGIGLDEDTAVEITAEKMTVWGKGHARFYERSAEHTSSLGSAGKGKRASVRKMLYSVLSEGDIWTR